MKKTWGIRNARKFLSIQSPIFKIEYFWGEYQQDRQDIKKSSNEEVVENYCNKGHTYVDTDGNFTVTKIDQMNFGRCSTANRQAKLYLGFSM